jgi:wyosine [tRNA(Phe)-imidazoG37] synthetase (radical SAM superfamily)
MKHVFGPVPSRRLGQSLGIDPVFPKTCNWNCVYCQLGRTIPLTNTRKEYIPTEEIFSEVEEALDQHPHGGIDWITFVGSGETMLASNVGILIEQIKQITNIPIAVITNGSILHLPEVRQELLMADAALPSLDAGNPWLYKKINRPHPEVTFEHLVGGLKQFRHDYHGKLWIEVMLMKDINDSAETLTEIAAHLKDIQPDEVHILLPTRPVVETWVRPADEEGLQRARTILGDVARVVDPKAGTFDLGQEDELQERIVDIITRHPMKETELLATLQKYPQINGVELLTRLERSRKVQIITRNKERYWSAVPAFYPENNQEER